MPVIASHNATGAGSNPVPVRKARVAQRLEQLPVCITTTAASEECPSTSAAGRSGAVIRESARPRPGGAGSSPAVVAQCSNAAPHITTAGSTRPRGGAHVVPGPVPPARVRSRSEAPGLSRRRADHAQPSGLPRRRVRPRVRRGHLAARIPTYGYPSPRFRLEIADCTNQIRLEFDVETPGGRENSLYKIETLISSLRRFQAGLQAEAELRAEREGARTPAAV